MDQRFIKEKFEVYFSVRKAKKMFSNSIMVTDIEPLDEQTSKLALWLKRSNTGILWQTKALVPITAIAKQCELPMFADLSKVITGMNFRSVVEYGGEEFADHMVKTFNKARWDSVPIGEFYGAVLVDPSAGTTGVELQPTFI